MARERRRNGGVTRWGLLFRLAVVAALATGILSLISGCDFMSGLFGGKPAKAPAKKKAGAVKSAAAVKRGVPEKEKQSVDLIGYVYTPIGKRDPFKSYFQMMVPETEKKGRPLGPLQKFEIGQLKLVAIVWGISNPRAMVEAPDGKGYIVKRGTLIGKNWGKVTKIKRDEVIISEHYRAVDGRLIVNKISMRLPIEKEELRP